MSFCHQCGNKRSPGAKFCATCEVAFEDDSGIPGAPEPAETLPIFRQRQGLRRFFRLPLFREMAARVQSEKEIQFLYDEGSTAFPDSAITADGKVSVDKLIPGLASALPGKEAGLIVALTARDLAKSGCGSLFGYADTKRGICVVSTARLGASPDEIAPRLENVIRHEIGHLEGLRHCHRKGCLMEAAMRPENLDQRSGAPCSQCDRRLPSRKSRALHRVAAALLLVAVFVAMNVVATLLEPAPLEPFAFSPVTGDDPRPDGSPAGEHYLIFDGTPLSEPSLVTDPKAAAAELNRLFQLLEPPKLSAAAENTGKLASIVSGNHEILRISDPEAPTRAGRIAATLNTLLAFKGTATSSCADCHRDRKDEVLTSAARRRAGIGIGPF